MPGYTVSNFLSQVETVTNGVAELDVEENCSEQHNGAEDEDEGDAEDQNQGRYSA